MGKRILLLFSLLIFFISCTYKAPSESILMDFNFGDEFIGFRMNTIEGEVLESVPLNSKNQLIIYSSDRCGPCIDTLKSLNRLENIFLSNELII